jgi:hypothetical protein
MMKTCLFVLLAAVACSASAGIIVNIPSQFVPPSSAPTDISLDASFTLTAPTVSQPLIGYDLFLGVTGGSGFQITGVGTGSDRPLNTVFGTDPFFNVTTGPAGNTLYWFTDITAPGSPGTITDQSALLRIKAQLQPGASGTYHIDAYVNQWARPGDSTNFYSDIDPYSPPYYLVKIPDMTYPGATITVTLPGDANLDGTVNITDLSKVLTNYDTSSERWGDGDFNGDGAVNINDLSNVLTNYDQTAGAFHGVEAVPEPATLVLLLAGATCLLVWRRRK